MAVSFIISVRNGAAHLQRCLDSIYSQTSDQWEIIVIDAVSTDGTVDILTRNADRLAFWSSEPDSGIYDAWNKALPHVSGDWFHFLGCDDRLWDDGVVKTALPLLAALNPVTRIAYGRIGTCTPAGVDGGEYGLPWDRIARDFQTEMCIPHQGVFHHRALIDEGRRFRTDMPYAGDYEFLLDEVLVRPPAFLPGLKVAMWELGGASSSPRRAFAVLKDMRKAQSLHGIGNQGAWRFRYVKAWAKSTLWRWLGPNTTARMIDVWRRLTGRKALGRLDP